ncbi:MAG TPA: hypothetical protein VJZ51_01640 [Bacilli bacterium]|nr:hypothetical protein [Bacilli bacterium]
MNFEKIDLYYDLVDQACMIIYEDLHLDYFESFLRVSRDINVGLDDAKLSDEALKKLENIYEIITLENFYNEEVRLALELVIVKAFKHINFPLDLMTPDTINYLVAMIIKTKYPEQELAILDTNLGTGNMLNAVSNNLDFAPSLAGIEKNETLVKLAQATANLQQNDIVIYFQDVLNRVPFRGEVVVGDLAGYEYVGETSLELYRQGVNYFPYLVIAARLDNIVEDGYFVYIIDNDFFNKTGIAEFREFISDKATLVGLIVLPENMVQGDHVGKSLLIGKKAVEENYNMTVLRLENFEKENTEELFIKIKTMIEEI